MFSAEGIRTIAEKFDVYFDRITSEINTSHGDSDIRLNYILDHDYVLKISSQSVIQEARLQEISRLIARYRNIGVYCPVLFHTKNGKLSCIWEKDGEAFTCYMEEYAKYPVYEDGVDYDRRQVVEHLGVLAQKYTGVDLIDT